jgi:ATP-dependent DNA ligase
MNSNGFYTLLSSEEKEIVSVPHINSALDRLENKPPELDGELYCHGMPFEEIVSRTSRSVNYHQDAYEISYHIFDLVEMIYPQVVRLAHLKKLDETMNSPLIMVPLELCNNLDDVLRAYDTFVSQGYEGIVVRHFGAPYIRQRSTMMMKFKPKKDDYYKIIGYKEEVSISGEPKGRLGALECTSDNSEHFTVGSGLTDYQRTKLWESREVLSGKLAHVKYQHITTGKGVPRFPVFIEIIDVEPSEVSVGL